MSLNDKTLEELQGLTKKRIIELISESRTSCSGPDTIPKTADDSDGSSSGNYAPLLKDLISTVNHLRSQISDLQAKLAVVEARVSSATPELDIEQSAESDDSNDGVWHVVPGQRKKLDFAEALRQSVKSAFQEEKVKCDVIISKAQESDNDTNFVSDLCQRMNFQSKPSNPHRLGKIGSRPRLLKVSFPTAFDARSFIARYDQFRRENRDENPLRIRQSKTKEEQAVFSKGSKLAYELNTKARQDNLPESYSLRDNGAVWKFVKASDGKWRRDRDWRPVSGNEQ